MQTKTDVQGNAYTTAVSNDKLTNNDFMKLLIEQLKMQDPTKPMDTQAMLDSQLQMSTIQTNLDMANSMKALEKSYGLSSLSTSANLIDHIVEDGTTSDDGTPNRYKVDTIEKKNDGLYANVRSYSVVDGKEVYGATETLPLNNIKKVG